VLAAKSTAVHWSERHSISHHPVAAAKPDDRREVVGQLGQQLPQFLVREEWLVIECLRAF